MGRLLLVLAAGLLLGADDPKPTAGSDKDRLQGTWQAVSSQNDGRDDPDAQAHRLTFAGETFTIRRDGHVMIKGTFRIDPDKKPKTIDMILTEAPRDDQRGKTALGIYELDGDTLKWCVGRPGEGERPKEFAAKDGSRRMFVTLKRHKE